MNRNTLLFSVGLTLVMALEFGAAPEVEACTGEPPIDMCARQLMCGINVPKLHAIPLASSQEGDRAVQFLVPVTLFYETYNRESCWDCDPLHTGGSMDVRINCNQEGDVATEALIVNTTVEFDSLCCGANTGVAELEVVFPEANFGDLRLRPGSLFNGGLCRLTATAQVDLDDGSTLTVDCNDQKVSILAESPTVEGTPMLQLQSSNLVGGPQLGPVLVSAGSAPEAYVTITNESPYLFTGRIEWSSLNSNTVASCTLNGSPGPTTTFSTAGESGDAFTGVTEERNRCDEPPSPGTSVNPEWFKIVRLAPGESQLVPYWVRIWPGCFFGSGSQVELCASGLFGGELEGKYREMCITVPFIVDYRVRYCEGDTWPPEFEVDQRDGDADAGDSGGDVGDTTDAGNNGGDAPFNHADAGEGEDDPGDSPCTTDWDLVGAAPCGGEGGFPCYSVLSPGDWDNDGLSNDEEVFEHFTDPDSSDTDRDGVDDRTEIELGLNPNRADTDGDLLIDGRELEVGSDPLMGDTDGDTLSDWAEVNSVDGLGTDPTVADTDNDGWHDGLEARDERFDPKEAEFHTSPGTVDSDSDGLEDAEERRHGGVVGNPDTDGDGLSDGYEVYVSLTSVRDADSDDDGLDDGEEVLTVFSNPLEADTDGDGIGDAAEVNDHGTSPTRRDTDRDGLDDRSELEEHGTNPADADSDDGGATDGRELSLGLDPNDGEDDDGITNPQKGIVYLTENTGDAVPIVMLRESAPVGVEVADVSRQGISAGEYQGRVQELWRLADAAEAAGATVLVRGKLDFGFSLNDAESPVEITELEMGVKDTNLGENASTFVGEGRARLNTAPAEDLLFMHQVAVWVNGGSVVSVQVPLANAQYEVSGHSVDFSFEMALPDLDFSGVVLTHDFRGLQRQAFETDCSDGMDGDNDGGVDCDDDDCALDPACQPDEEDTGGGEDVGVGDDTGEGDQDPDAGQPEDAGTGGGGGGDSGGDGCGCRVGAGPAGSGMIMIGALVLLVWRRGLR